jgi:outer membrane receptor protein involved in Fe transport
MQHLLGRGVTCAVILAAGHAHAQDNPGATEVRVLEEVVVTATKRETSLQDTALSVGVLSGQELIDAGVRDIHDYWRQIPSLVVSDQAFGGDRIVIRGLGEEPIGITESMSALYLDETPINQADGLFTLSPSFELVDIERVEVLRGPQGTLFGANAMGGAVRLLTRQPELGTQYGSIDGNVSFTDHGGTNYGGNIVWNTPAGDQAALRVVAWYQDNDGWIDSIGPITADNINTHKVAGGRFAMGWEASERFSLTLKVQYQDSERGGFNGVDPIGKPDIGLLTEGDYQIVQFSESFRNEEASIASLTLDYDTGWGDWTAITSWLDFEVSMQADLHEEARYLFFGFYAPAFTNVDYDQEAVMQEIRVASKPGSTLQWLAGLFYLDQDVPRFETISWTDNPLPVNTDILLQDDVLYTREDLGLFGELSWDFAEAWSATIGARWYDVSKTYSSTFTGLPTGFQPVVTQSRHGEDGVTPKASLAWQFREGAMLYALASQGYRAGGANTALAVNVCGAPGSYESDDLWNYEIGLKSLWQDGRMQLNVTLYTIDWSDAQTEVSPPGCNNVYIVNAGQAQSDGVEFESVWLASEDWELRLVAGYNDSRVTQAVPGSGIASGTSMPLIPDWTAAATSTNYFPVGKYEGFFRADWQYTGKSQTSLFASRNVEQDAYNLFNLRLGIENEAWRATIFADNVFDEHASLVCCRQDGGYVTVSDEPSRPAGRLLARRRYVPRRAIRCRARKRRWTVNVPGRARCRCRRLQFSCCPGVASA